MKKQKGIHYGRDAPKKTKSDERTARQIRVASLKAAKMIKTGFFNAAGMAGVKLKAVSWPEVIGRSIPYILVFYLTDKGAWLYRHCVAPSAAERVLVMVVNFNLAFSKLMPSMVLTDLTAGAVGAMILKGVVTYRKKNAKKYRQGQEYGSARWGTPKDIAPFIDPVFENNIILTKTERLTMNGRPKKPEACEKQKCDRHRGQRIR